MLAKAPPLGLFQVQTFGGVYSGVSFIGHTRLFREVAGKMGSRPVNGNEIGRGIECAIARPSWAVS